MDPKHVYSFKNENQVIIELFFFDLNKFWKTKASNLIHFKMNEPEKIIVNFIPDIRPKELCKDFFSNKFNWIAFLNDSSNLIYEGLIDKTFSFKYIGTTEALSKYAII